MSVITALKDRIRRSLQATTADVEVVASYTDWIDYGGAYAFDLDVKSQSGNGQYDVFLALQGELVAETSCTCPDFNNPELDWSDRHHPSALPYYSDLLGHHRLCKHVLLALRLVAPDVFRLVIAQELQLQHWASRQSSPSGHRGAQPWEIQDAGVWARNILAGRTV